MESSLGFSEGYRCWGGMSQNSSDLLHIWSVRTWNAKKIFFRSKNYDIRYVDMIFSMFDYRLLCYLLAQCSTQLQTLNWQLVTSKEIQLSKIHIDIMISNIIIFHQKENFLCVSSACWPNMKKIGTILTYTAPTTEKPRLDSTYWGASSDRWIGRLVQHWKISAKIFPETFVNE